MIQILELKEKYEAIAWNGLQRTEVFKNKK